MKITPAMLRRIIKEEIAKADRQQKTLAEGTVANPIQITPEYLNRLIREEYAAAQNRQRLSESRRCRSRKVYR